jgi:hypothetical protein
MSSKSDIVPQADHLSVDEEGQKLESRIAIHTDTYDIDEDALGINLPKRYYFSPGFIGTVVVCHSFLFQIHS